MGQIKKEIKMIKILGYFFIVCFVVFGILSGALGIFEQWPIATICFILCLFSLYKTPLNKFSQNKKRQHFPPSFSLIISVYIDFTHSSTLFHAFK